MSETPNPTGLTALQLVSLEGRVIFITGEARGIGLDLSKACLDAGATVAVTDILPQPDPDSLVGQSGVPERFIYFQCDLTKEEELNSTFNKIYKKVGHVDGIITAAGICIDKPFLEHTWEDIQRQQSVNETGTFFAVQNVVRRMKERKRKGSIVMICSQTAEHVAPGHQLSAYSGSKGFVWSFARNLAHELAADGIRVNTISPGYIATDMNLSIAAHRPDLLRIFHKAPPLGRAGKPDDLKMAALYLLGEGSSYVTGHNLVVDGGMGVSSGNFPSKI